MKYKYSYLNAEISTFLDVLPGVSRRCSFLCIKSEEGELNLLTPDAYPGNWRETLFEREHIYDALQQRRRT